MTTENFLGWYHNNPKQALKFLISMIDVFIKQDAQKFKLTQQEHLNRINQSLSESSNTKATQKKNSYLQDKREFKEFLSKQAEFENMHPYLWEELKDFGLQLLMESNDVKVSQELLDAFGKFQPVIDELKTEQGLTPEDIRKLSEISLPKKFEKAVLKKMMSSQKQVNTKRIDARADIDCRLLKDRIKQCKAIWKDVRDILQESLVKNGLVAEEDFMFAGVKDFGRSSVKLLNYFEKNKNKLKHQGVEEFLKSALYDLKDLLRGSIITDSPEATEKVVDALLNLGNAKVVDMKNGFQPRAGQQFDPNEYHDIKVILLVGSGDEQGFEELVEIQVIQRINIQQKKLSHKQYDFTREMREFLKKAEENKKLQESFQKAVSAHDVESADHLSNSDISSLQTVRSALLDYYPHLQYSKMDKQQLLQARFAFRNGPFHTLFVTLQALSEVKEEFNELKLSLNKDEVLLSTFEIDEVKYFYKPGSEVTSIATTEDANKTYVGLANGRILT